MLAGLLLILDMFKACQLVFIQFIRHVGGGPFYLSSCYHSNNQD